MSKFFENLESAVKNYSDVQMRVYGAGQFGPVDQSARPPQGLGPVELEVFMLVLEESLGTPPTTTSFPTRGMRENLRRLKDELGENLYLAEDGTLQSKKEVLIGCVDVKPLIQALKMDIAAKGPTEQTVGGMRPAYELGHPDVAMYVGTTNMVDYGATRAQAALDDQQVLTLLLGEQGRGPV